MRSGALYIAAGYDGEYGVVKLFQPGEAITQPAPTRQISLFGTAG